MNSVCTESIFFFSMQESELASVVKFVAAAILMETVHNCQL